MTELYAPEEFLAPYADADIEFVTAAHKRHVESFLLRQLRFHIPGEVCEIYDDEPSCVICEREFHITEGRSVNNAVIWAWLMTGEVGYSYDFYLLGPAETLAWLWDGLYNPAFRRTPRLAGA